MRSSIQWHLQSTEHPPAGTTGAQPTSGSPEAKLTAWTTTQLRTACAFHRPPPKDPVDIYAQVMDTGAKSGDRGIEELTLLR